MIDNHDDEHNDNNNDIDDINNNNNNDVDLETTTNNNDDNGDDIEDLDRETADVMKERVASNTRNNYERSNIRLLIWLFDNRNRYSDLIRDSLMGRMIIADASDKGRTTRGGRPSKARTDLRKVCREVLVNIDSEDEASTPLKLELLTFKVFARYLNTLKKTVKKKNSNNDRGKEDVQIRLNISSYDAACSALSHLYIECGLDKHHVSRDLWTKLSTYKKGSRRKSTKEKKDLGMRSTSGMKPLPFSAYRLLAKILFESADPEHIPAHAFLVTAWNLVSRSEFVVDSKIDLISVHEDGILFDMGITKTDQDGTRNIDHPWHCYANPLMPEICIALAIGRHLICNPTILAGQCDLFEGSSQYERFNKIYNDIINDDQYRDEFVSLGIPPEFFGTHSLRKGAICLIANGSTACPPISSICIRANWNMPGVMNRYIKWGEAGDMFVAKSVSGRHCHRPGRIPNRSLLYN